MYKKNRIVCYDRDLKNSVEELDELTERLTLVKTIKQNGDIKIENIIIHENLYQNQKRYTGNGFFIKIKVINEKLRVGSFKQRQIVYCFSCRSRIIYTRVCRRIFF